MKHKTKLLRIEIEQINENGVPLEMMVYIKKDPVCETAQIFLVKDFELMKEAILKEVDSIK